MVGRKILGSRERSKNLYLPIHLVPHLLEEGCRSAEFKFRAATVPLNGALKGLCKHGCGHFMDVLSSPMRVGKRGTKETSQGKKPWVI